jgi:hypothetical protein
LLAHGRWFSPGTPASSTTKTGHHDIAEILLKVVLKHQKSNQIIKCYKLNEKYHNLKKNNETLSTIKHISPTPSISTVKPVHVFTSIKQSPALKGHLLLVLS